MRRRGVALALGIALAISAAACGNSGAPAVSDPSEILTKALEAVQNAKTVHLEATVDGTVKLDLSGTGTAGDIALTGTKLTGDVDIAGGDAHIGVEIPAMLGMTADAIVVDDTTYIKSSLTGALYEKGTAGDLGVPVNPADPKASLDEIRTWLKKPEVDPKKLDDTNCNGKTCYQVKIELTSDELKSLSPDMSQMGDGSINLTFLVDRDSLRFATLKADITASTVGNVTVTLNFSKWDESVTITAPPADQIQG